MCLEYACMKREYSAYAVSPSAPDKRGNCGGFKDIFSYFSMKT